MYFYSSVGSGVFLWKFRASGVCSFDKFCFSCFPGVVCLNYFLILYEKKASENLFSRELESFFFRG